MAEIRLRGGRIANGSFTDYLIPTILDVPPINSGLACEPEPAVPTE